MSSSFVDNAKVMAKGQITIPKDVRSVLGISVGDRVTFVVDGDNVRIVNSAVFAMKMLQSRMADVTPLSEDEVMDLVSEIRTEVEADENPD